jgi:AAA domain
MSRPLLIRQITLVTSGSRHNYRFRPGINVITGPIGTGKSSLLELIRYAFGGEAILTNAVQQAVLNVVLEVQLGDDRFLLEREIDSNIVRTTNATTGEELTYSVRRSMQYPRISSFLLAALGLPEARLVRSRTQPSASSSPLSFYDYYAYCYVPQTEIDRSIVRHLDKYREGRRRAAFELLFGLSNEEVLGLEVRAGQLAQELVDARAAEAAVSRFLRSSGDATDESLVLQQAEAGSDLNDARLTLQRLRETARTRTLDEEPLRQQLAAAGARLQELGTREAQLQAEATERTRVVAQLELDLRKLERTRAAAKILNSIEFVQCPRCLQPLQSNGNELCYVCNQPEPPTSAEADTAYQIERRRLVALEEEVKSLVAASRSELELILQERTVATLNATRLQAQIDERTRRYVSPLFEMIARTSARIAAAEARLEAIDRARTHWAKHRELSAQVRSLELQINGVNTDIAEAKARFQSRRQRVGVMSSLFDEIVAFLQPPWYTPPARIDERDYLPVINNGDFDALSGGEKTVMNVAYHLTLLSYALRDGMTNLPYFLILDSPRKNVGFIRDDRSLVQRMYRRFEAFRGVYGDGYQLIIADNDVPTDVTVHFSTRTQLTYDRPLIPDFDHPGPGRVETIGPGDKPDTANH